MRKSTDSLDALRRCADAYGANTDRWPAQMRKEFADLLDTDEAAGILAEAQFLDGFLNAASAPRVSADLTNRIMARYEPPKAPAGFASLLLGLAPGMRLLPAGALAGLGAIGLASGIMTASAQEPLTPEYEALAYVDDLPVSTLYENGDLSWDAE